MILDINAHASFDWSMPDRYDDSWAAYRFSTGTYRPQFVNPGAWSIRLNGCSSTAVHAITGYVFTLTQASTGWTRTITSKTCATHYDSLPALGAYDVRLSLTTDWGLNQGVSTPVRRPALLKDFLVVSMGDSLASGEGNPDVRGTYVLGHELVPVQWKDSRCHRSALSGPARSAQAIEDADPHTSVTFVSVACSGATIANVSDKPYQGIVAQAGFSFPGQVTQVTDLVGPGSMRGGRPIDALLLSAGANDLHFGNLIKRCAKPWTGVSCVRKADRERDLAGLPASFRKLAVAIRDKLPSTGRVLVNDYPVHLFKDGACGVLRGLWASKGRAIARVGIELNQAIARTIRLHSGSPYRWRAVADLDVPFTPHPYCGSSTWFTRLEWSERHQGDVEGTAHPNGPGHRAYGAILRNALAPVLAALK